MIKKTAPPTPPSPPPERPKPTTIWTIPVHPPDPNSRTAKAPPIGKVIRTSLVLLALCGTAWAQAPQVVTAPNNNAGACPFPGCQGVTSVTDVSMAPYTAGGTGDSSGAIQRAIDSGSPVVYFPAGQYFACNLIPRAQNQVWQGAGKHQTILQATPGCVNLIVLSTTSGPATSWELTGFTLKSNGTANSGLINMDGGGVLRANIHDNAFDVGTGYALGGTGATGITWSGGADLNIERNECYSVLPGYGNCFTVFRAARNTRILNNTWRWVFTGTQINTLQGAEDVEIGSNVGDLGWYAEPVKLTNSGGTVTYGATTLTDTAANFTGLCADAGTPGACSSQTGNFIRVLTTVVTGTAAASFRFAPGIINDSGITTASVQRGQIVRTGLLCRGNGTFGPTWRYHCTGSAGTSAFGDGCACTTAADCGSARCEKRFATVMGVIDGTKIAIDEWTSDVDRRPVGPPNDATAYTVFSWVMGAVGSYTPTVITLNTGTASWFDWFGTNSTPGAGSTYEILTKHPNYHILVASTAPVIQKGRIHDNTLTRGHSDQIGINAGQNFTVSGNMITDGQDVGITVDGITGVNSTAGTVVTGNIIDHQGSIGIFVGGNDLTVANNVMQNISWANTNNTTSLGCILAQGGNRANITGNKCLVTLAMAANRYGFAVAGTTDGTQFSNNQAQGTLTQGMYRLAAGTVTNTHIANYHGEAISTAGGPTVLIEGGLAAAAGLPTVAAAGSYLGCSDCTIASPTAGGGTGAMAIRSSTGPQWNGR